MSTWIIENDRVILTIGIKIKTKRILTFTSKRVSAYESSDRRIVVSRSEIDCASLRIKVFTAITKSISISTVSILLNTKCIVAINLCYCSICICKINYISMCILNVINVFSLSTVNELIFSCKICSADIAVCFIRITSLYVSNDLLASVPYMIDTLTVDYLLYSKSGNIVCIARSCCSVCKSNQLVQPIIGICFCSSVSCFRKLVSVCIICI